MGSAVSAPIKQQVKALKGRRYMRGMLPEKYFEVVVKKEHGELLDILGFSEEEAFEIFVQVYRYIHTCSLNHTKYMIHRGSYVYGRLYPSGLHTYWYIA